MESSTPLIPKRIHYVWFGRNPLPPLARKCIESWKKFCPDWEIIEWNEDNFQLSVNAYVREAYEARRWAFVSDYVRLYALVTQGGFYMDTDCELIKPIDRFRVHDAVAGFESKTQIQTALMGCREGFPFFKALLADYDHRHFIKPNGSHDLTTNVKTITDICLKHGLVLNNTLQTIDGFTLYPSEYFCPKDWFTQKGEPTGNTCAIHHFDTSWQTEKEKRYYKIIVPVSRLLEKMPFLYNLARWVLYTFTGKGPELKK